MEMLAREAIKFNSAFLLHRYISATDFVSKNDRDFGPKKLSGGGDGGSACRRHGKFPEGNGRGKLVETISASHLA